MLEKHYSIDLGDPTGRENIRLSMVWRDLLKQSRLILKITLALLVLAVIYIVFSTPKFLSTSSLYSSGMKAGAAPDNDVPDASAPSYMNSISDFVSVSDTQTQIDIMSNPALVKQAVLASGLNVALTGPGIPAPSYLAWKLFDRSSVEIYSPQQTSLSASFVDFTDPAVKQGKYEISFGSGGHYTVSKAGTVILNGTLNNAASGGGLSLLLQSYGGSAAPPSGSVYHLKAVAPSVTAAGVLKSGFSAATGGTTTLPSEVINLTFSSTNPYQAQNFLNSLMTEYVDKTVSWNSDSASKMEDFITQQLADVEGKMRAADAKLSAYQRQTGVISPPDNAKAAIDQEAQYESQQVGLQLQIKALQQSLQSLDGPAGQVNPYLVSDTSGTPLSVLSEKLAEDLASLRSDQARFNGSSTNIAAEEAQIDQERIGVRSMLKNELNAAQANIAGVNAEIAAYQTQIGAMPAQTLQVAGLTRASDVLGDLYVLLMQKQQEAAISKTAAVSSTQIIMPAALPLTTSSPKPSVILPLTLFVGLIGGSGFVLLRNLWEGRLKSESEIRDSIGEPIFATLPSVVRGTPVDQKLMFDQALQMLRINIEQTLSDRPSKIVLLTASSDQEQKSGVALNLARVLAAEGKRVALLDADFRSGHLGPMLKIDRGSSLSNWLSTGEAPALQNPTGESFAFLPARQAGDEEVSAFTDARILSTLSQLRTTYEYVIIDGPTPPASADVLTFASRADLVLSVVEAGVSMRKLQSIHHSRLAKVSPLRAIVVIDAYA